MKPKIQTLTDHCEKHGKYEYEQAEIFGRTVASKCPQCYSEITAQQESEEERDARALKESHWHNMGIEPEFYPASFENFEAHNKSLGWAKRVTQEMVAKKRGKAVMLGDNGIGKTHLACCVIKALGGEIRTMYEITTEIRASYSAIAKETELDIVRRYASIPMLVIDEMGRTKGSDAELNWLSYIIDKRHARGLPLILISNNHEAKNCTNGGCPKCFERYIGEDVMSRLSTGTVILNMAGDDQRRDKKGLDRAGNA